MVFYVDSSAADASVHDRLRQGVYDERSEGHQYFLRVQDEEIYEESGYVGFCA